MVAVPTREVPSPPAASPVVTPWRAAQADGPTMLQALLSAAVLVGSTALGLYRVLDGQTVGVIYIAVLGHVYREVRRRPISDEPEARST